MSRPIPLRVDFAGGWLDVPRYAREGAYIVNCAIEPFKAAPGSGLGTSAAWAWMSRRDVLKAELAIAGWQDAAIIQETGLCVWRSGPLPVLDVKRNPDFLRGKMAVLYTGKSHSTADLVDRRRNYEAIEAAAWHARSAVLSASVANLGLAMTFTYQQQLCEGMDPLPDVDAAKKYLGSGHGGYALYLFITEAERARWLEEMRGRHDVRPIEPHMDGYGMEGHRNG